MLQGNFCQNFIEIDKYDVCMEFQKRKDLMSNGASGCDLSAKVFTGHPVKSAQLATAELKHRFSFLVPI